LTVAQVLRWADAHHARTGKWPNRCLGDVQESPDNRWSAIDAALHAGNRGLPGGGSLAQLLSEHRHARYKMALPRLTIGQLLAWADRHRESTGDWPTVLSGPVIGAPGETWNAIHLSLRLGRRGLRRGSSLARLLCKHRGRASRLSLPQLTYRQILAWADAHHRKMGNWPTTTSGFVKGAEGIQWAGVNSALNKGLRGLPAGTSLRQLLVQHRGVRDPFRLPGLTAPQIVRWAESYFKRAGRWPNAKSGPIPETQGDTWKKIDRALIDGRRGLPGGSSLFRLLGTQGLTTKPLRPTQAAGGRTRRRIRSRLTIRQILAWADEHHEREGSWPTKSCGSVPGETALTWSAVDACLVKGLRGLRPGGSLAQLLERQRRVRNLQHLPPLSVERILAWADAHHKSTGRWPSCDSGPVRGSSGETWSAIFNALYFGGRGLPGHTTLAQLLAEHRDVRNRGNLPKLDVEQILNWADQYHRRCGVWPQSGSGPIPDAEGETWYGIDCVLRSGGRGLPSGSSLPRLLAEHRGVRNLKNLPRLTVPQILAWADEHRRVRKEWPHRDSGSVEGVEGETWSRIDSALRVGSRGLARGYSLARLLAERRGLRNRWSAGRLAIKHILLWADEHKRRTGTWPLADSGSVDDAPGESWNEIDTALAQGARGLPGGDSLRRLLARRRGRTGDAR
jgi:hypothetical protein